MGKANEGDECPENFYSHVDDSVYKLAELHAGQRTMSRLAELAVTASEGEIDFESALESVKSLMGTSLDLTVSRTVIIGGKSPAEMRGELNKE